MEKDFRVAELADFYRGLLTERQADILDRYYNLDCSLAEIAESCGITRQSVRDAIMSGRDALFHYESALKLAEKHAEVSALLAEALRTCTEEETREILIRIKKAVES